MLDRPSSWVGAAHSRQLVSTGSFANRWCFTIELTTAHRGSLLSRCQGTTSRRLIAISRRLFSFAIRSRPCSNRSHVDVLQRATRALTLKRSHPSRRIRDRALRHLVKTKRIGARPPVTREPTCHPRLGAPGLRTAPDNGQQRTAWAVPHSRCRFAGRDGKSKSGIFRLESKKLTFEYRDPPTRYASTRYHRNGFCTLGPPIPARCHTAIRNSPHVSSMEQVD